MTVGRPDTTTESTRRRLSIAGWIVAGWIVALLLLVPAFALVRESLALPIDLLTTPSLSGGIRLDEMAFGVGTAFGDGAGLVLVTGVAIAGLTAMRLWGDALFVAIAVVSATIVVRLAKNIFDAPRPPTVGLYSPLVLHIPNMAVVVIALIVIGGGLLSRWPRQTFIIGGSLLALLAAVVVAGKMVPVIRGLDSFPSGHAMNSMALSCAVALIAIRRWPAHRWVLLLAASYALLIGVSRVYLRTHYEAEVLAGWALAVAWVLTCWLVLRRLDGSTWRGHQGQQTSGRAAGDREIPPGPSSAAP